MKIIKTKKGLDIFVDDCDYDFFSRHTWNAWKVGNNYYATTNIPGTNGKRQSTIAMHRLIMPVKKGYHCDHINRNGLDNRRDNLRYVTPQQNKLNSRPRTGHSSKYKGVTFFKRDKLWVARITINKKLKHIGRYKTEIEAAIAYNKSAIINFGDFAYINEIGENKCQITSSFC